MNMLSHTGRKRLPTLDIQRDVHSVSQHSHRGRESRPSPAQSTRSTLPPSSSSSSSSSCTVEAENVSPTTGSSGWLAPALSQMSRVKKEPKSTVVVPDLDLDDLLQVGDVMGSGAGGFVVRVLHEPTSSFYALKYIVLEEHVMHERSVLQSIESPYFPTFYHSYCRDGYLILLMELMDCGSLHDFCVKNARRVPEVVLAQMTIQVLHALDYIHNTMHRIHRDIKPANILLNSKGAVKVIDFGISSRTANDLQNSFTGTPAYMAPERLSSEAGYTNRVDIWGLGITLYELSMGRNPYSSFKSEIDLMFSLVHRKEIPVIPPGEGYSEDFRDFVAVCLTYSPDARPSVRALLDQPFVRFASTKDSIVKWVNQFPPLFEDMV
eukprot:TRINITY_DN1078_c0_g1_i1.p1 TRINITY_DN1078_c0_g1~~TRINITY_DN1078_c0_g1_i1.p1  ORF type:complete len:405 (-),score=80.68 TRINITY_DN1078_c0_g1_i1:87-1223(-)